MTTRHVCVVVLLGLGSFALESCSSDSTPFTPVEAGGEGGDAGGKGGSGASSGKGGGGANSGKGGSGASSGNGSSGSAGDGNAAGASGADGGGAGGEGGQAAGVSGSSGGGEAGAGAVSGGGGESAAAGRAGEGGVPASGGSVSGGGGFVAGGDGGGGAGEGGASDAGAGGRGTPEELKHCAYECSTDDDCAFPGVITYVCDPVSKRCGAPDLTCVEHRDCVPFASSWTVSCEKDDDCPSAADVCVDAGEAGRCARLFEDGTPCPLPDHVEVLRLRFAEPNVEVGVCGKANGRCGDGACFLGCTGSGDCGQGDGDTCDTESGRCTCVADNECTSGAVSHCNPRTQRCDECASDFDCFLDASRDQCVRGRCGCSSENACSELVFPAATPVCE